MPTSPLGPESLAPGSTYRFDTRRTAAATKRTSPYPSPFFDAAQTYMPTEIKALFRWCRYYALTNPLISTVLYKMSSYPITELVYEAANEGVKEKWRTVFEDQFQIRSFVVESNLDRNCYGNSFVSVSFPFRKYLTCKSCQAKTPVDRSKYRFKGYEFHLACEKCGANSPAKVEDRYLKSVKGTRLIRWNPERIRIKLNEITGKRTYFYDLPQSIKSDVINGKQETVETIPQAFIEALKKKKTVFLREGSVFHMRRPSVSRPDDAWGMPMLLPVLKDVFYLQLLKKAQEAIFLGYITPMRVFYPAASGSSSDPYQFMNLSNWKERVSAEIQAHRADSLYIPVMPVPVGYQNVGGEGKALMLSQEIRVWSEHIVAGMGVPPELVFSGLSWSSSSVSLRMLENEFTGNRDDNIALVRFIRDRLSAHFGWPTFDPKFKLFKMADDLQRAAFDLQLVQQKMLSRQTLLEQRDHDYETERRRVKEELASELEIQREQMEYQSTTQGRQQVIMSQYQVRAQQAMQQLQPQPTNGGQPMPGAEQQGQEGQQQQGQQGQQQPSQPPGVQGAIGGDNPIVSMGSPIGMQNVQPLIGENGEMMGGNMAIGDAAGSLARQVSGAESSQQGLMLSALKMRDVNLYSQVLQQLGAPQEGTPLPSQGAPRRGPGTAQI